MLRAIGCDLGFPLSYSFLRRFARTLESVEMRTLTLARFILEISVHFFDHALELPSKLAAACLVLALKKSSPIQDDWVSLEFSCINFVFFRLRASSTILATRYRSWSRLQTSSKWTLCDSRRRSPIVRLSLTNTRTGKTLNSFPKLIYF
jgi:hypothetical protein